ncbi:MAG: photosynthetic complex putative assembly protein PuhB [Rhodobacter sp.]|nr:photosynthetic complex putative assembly protein PuhB [Rhodobacter sp.]
MDGKPIKEPIEGLPDLPPDGERILWQGRPDWWALTKSALAFWWVAGYFALLALWRFLSVVDHMPLPQAIGASVPLVVLGMIVGALLLLTALIQARATVYTLTDRRVAMRIGAALTVTLNLPYTQIGSADLDLRNDGTGTIALSTVGDARLSYLMLWPHVRPWHIHAKPSLRCIPEARRVADMIAEAATARITTPRISRRPGTVPVTTMAAR